MALRCFNNSSFKISGTGNIVCSAPVVLEDGTSFTSSSTQAFSLPNGLVVGDEYRIEMDWTNALIGRIRFQFEIWGQNVVNTSEADYYFSLAIRGQENTSSYEFRKSSRINGNWATGSDENNIDDYSSVTNPFSDTFFIYVKKETATTTSFTVRESNDTTVFFTETYTDADDSLLSSVNRIGFSLTGSGPGDAEATYTITKIN